MLRHLDVAHDRFGLSTPFRISRGVKTAADVVTVTLREGGTIGRGEAVPYARYGETIEDTIAAIRAIAPALADGAGRQDLAALLPAGAARNAVDCALWDLEARLAGTTVAALAGLDEPVALPSAITIGLDTPDAMARAAAKVATVPLLKVKVDRTDPAAQIAAIRSVAPLPRLIVDPNESWTIDTLRSLRERLIEWRVDLLEQPLPAGEDHDLATFDSPVPIAADEALHTAADLDRLAGRYDVVNIKLDKTGGLTEALVLAGRAHAKGFGLMVGCMVCSSLGIAPAMQLGGRASFVDLDGPLWLSEDRAGGVTDHEGMLSPATPGFWGN
ncbi:MULTISPECIES: N-acetyl-D-Glu racemase DgcA [Sphingomonas]|jgi:L-alanine-DL-glutamate epimerase-like enolase superfamily enzyme|uniref:Dipeptide epimerase n=1 Tax=Sphingomonas hankookensis TaxID=563996 RepID=A0ABR5YD23_9SPHN|nr:MULTISPECIES: N-acetyl-D-Glu racemase DgcA [Sphingomonas]KZE15910.1 dipeptide epimerase [Sphingomonas hankookensis]PZT91286.1 MAG: dipeptide epimerase [Sphingomonas sp.]WCP73224.1 dipeptide epimerase [Sphingomonas hankookensis]